MGSNTITGKIRTFFGLQQQPPQNDFRNPIWGSDDDDDEDELYTKQQMDVHEDIHREFAKQMRDTFDVFKTFSTMFGDMKSFFQDDFTGSFEVPAITEIPSEHDNFDSNNIRDYYLKPGYHQKHEHPQDMDLDGKISSNEISGLLKRKDETFNKTPTTHFNGKLVPGKSFCQTVITTSITKPDGTIETRRIIKNGHDVIEETTTTRGPELRGPSNGGLDAGSPNIYNSVMSDALSSLFRNFY